MTDPVRYFLKPCPFCGSQRVAVREYITDLMGLLQEGDPEIQQQCVWFTVHCHDCHAEQPSRNLAKPTPEYAVEAWNRRPVDRVVVWAGSEDELESMLQGTSTYSASLPDGISLT